MLRNPAEPGVQLLALPDMRKNVGTVTQPQLQESGWACRNCGSAATVAIHSGFEAHPTCDECAAWWAEWRRVPLAEVAPDYEYEGGS